MSAELFEEEGPTFAGTRSEALAALKAFIPRAGRYSRDRNKVLPGHPNVSRLSPAVRHRLITEEECAAAPLERYAASTVEKFRQEVYWRRYWKSWLSLRPQVWADYRAKLGDLRGNQSLCERAESVAAGEGPVAIMGHFARELVATGYLHNHARMWFAGWWVHVEGLPWELGADFFFRHLLDADPASNTLSWRWVAGLQTPGKTYLPRRGNIEKYVDPAILDGHRGGLELLERPQARRPEVCERPAITRPELAEGTDPGGGRIGIWIHEEDLLPEVGPLADVNPVAVLVAGDRDSWKENRYAAHRIDWLERALSDARERAARHYGMKVRGDSVSALVDWAQREKLARVVAMRPEVGPLADRLDGLRATLAEAGVELDLRDRAEDLAHRSLATGGFFTFWKKLQAQERQGELFGGPRSR